MSFRLETDWSDAAFALHHSIIASLQVGQVLRQYTAGNCGVVVCHIDSGTHWNSNNWYNAGEYAGIPLVDDDGNGVVLLARFP